MKLNNLTKKYDKIILEILIMILKKIIFIVFLGKMELERLHFLV